MYLFKVQFIRRDFYLTYTCSSEINEPTCQMNRIVNYDMEAFTADFTPFCCTFFFENVYIYAFAHNGNNVNMKFMTQAQYLLPSLLCENVAFLKLISFDYICRKTCFTIFNSAD